MTNVDLLMTIIFSQIILQLDLAKLIVSIQLDKNVLTFLKKSQPKILIFPVLCKCFLDISPCYLL